MATSSKRRTEPDDDALSGADDAAARWDRFEALMTGRSPVGPGATTADEPATTPPAAEPPSGNIRVPAQPPRRRPRLSLAVVSGMVGGAAALALLVAIVAIATAPVPKPIVAAGPGGVRLVVAHLEADSAIASALAERLSTDWGAVSLRAVEHPPEFTHTRYFRPEDRVEAEAVHAALLDALPGRPAAPSATDFGFYTPLPEPGVIEVWVAPPSR